MSATVIPAETREAILKMFKDHLHINNRCATLHETILFGMWPHSDGHAQGTCSSCGLVMLKALPDWVPPPPVEDPFKNADFGIVVNHPQPDTGNTDVGPKRRKKATEATNEAQT